ncbi:hypothetical protein EDD17DRAFT_78781 [Pisolithus thermaeus]|nr:hypothetical protein EDD17DRAFT_78781 [Pisolithus thermaeus]
MTHHCICQSQETISVALLYAASLHSNHNSASLALNRILGHYCIRLVVFAILAVACILIYLCLFDLLTFAFATSFLFLFRLFFFVFRESSGWHLARVRPST